MREYIFPIIISFFMTWIGTKVFIPLLKKNKVGQEIREDGPQSHLKKAGTPTMGGLVFAQVILILSLVLVKFDHKIISILVGMLGFGGIGFIDDLRKMKQKQSEGLTPKQKLIFQFSLAFIMVLILYIFQKEEIRNLRIPFFNWVWDLWFFSIPILAFIIVGTVNAVNLTDGLDGLLAGVSIPVFLLLGFIGVMQGEKSLAKISFISLGSLLGFSVFNSNPASIFMGDTGSMTIGGLVAILAVGLRIPIYLIVFGGIYFIEALSVIIQVAHYKRTKKRIFLMSPIHHHFELKGYKEQKVTSNFAIASWILCFIALLIL